MLLSKINSQMLIQCESQISKEQVAELQKYKERQDKFNTNQEDYQKIIAIDLNKFNVQELSEEGYKVEFTPQENQMLSMIEDINDNMNRQLQKEAAKSGRNAVNIAFFDVSAMSGPVQALYLLAIMGGLGAALYWFYNLLVQKPELAEQERQKRLEAKKAKREKKKV